MDLNGDGQLDILSGSYWAPNAKHAYVYALFGRAGEDFAKPVPLNTAAGSPISTERFSDDDKDLTTSKICVEQFATDWDGDGDLDLVLGNFEGTFCVSMNVGDKKNPKFADEVAYLMAGDDLLRVPGAHSAPFAVDWDGDGDQDLLSGSSSGGVYLAVNQGTAGKPVFKAFETLIAPPPNDKRYKQFVAAGEQPLPGGSTRIWLADYNGDGKLDILLGDSVTLEVAKNGLSKQEVEAREVEHNAKMTEASTAYRKAWQAAREAEGDEAVKLQAAVRDHQQRMSQLRAERLEYLDSSRTGFVWLFIQK